MKRILTVLTLCLLVLCLFGCDTVPDVTTTEPQRTEPQNALPPINITEMDGYTIQYLPAEVENPDNLPVLKWVCLTERFYGSRDRLWNEMAVREVNQMLAEKNQPYRIQFVVLATKGNGIDSGWFEKTGVKELLAKSDLIYADMDAKELTQYLMPITQYVNGSAEPSLENAVPHSMNWVCATVDGEIYGIPSLANQANVLAWVLSPGAQEQFGLNASDFSADPEKMDTLFAQIYEKNGRKPFLCAPDVHRTINAAIYGLENPTIPGIVGDVCQDSYEPIGSFFALDLSSGTPEVISLLEGETVRVWQAAFLRWRDAGYITGDYSGLIQLSTTVTKEAYTAFNGYTYFPVGNPYFPYATAWGHTTGISATSSHPEDAAALLSLIANDETFRLQLLYGKEGRDYTVENGYYTFVKQADGSNYGLEFLSPLACFCGLTPDPDSAKYINVGAATYFYPEINGKTHLEIYREALDGCTPWVPIAFDFSGLQTQIAQMDERMHFYFNLFTNNIQIEDDEETEEDEFIPRMDGGNYQIMLDELKAAGGDKILAELQRQLDAWLEANPDWNK